MKITRKEVEYVARLARLSLQEEEKEKFTFQLEKILQYIEQLQKVDVSAIPAVNYPRIKSHWRKDTPEKKNYSEKILQNSPQRQGQFFKIKKVIE